MKKLCFIIVIVLHIAILRIPAYSAVTDLPTDTFLGYTDVGFFKDLTTDRTWLDIDNFFPSGSLAGLTYNSLNALLFGSGYHIATLDELLQLQASVPAIPANFFLEEAIIGGNTTTRNLIWGVYDDGTPTGNPSSSWWYQGENFWNNGNATLIGRDDLLENAQPFHKDMGAWVVSDATVVPEPISSTLFIVGGATLGFRRLCKKRRIS